MSISAMKQALEALEQIHPGNMTPMAEEAWNKSITALRQAIAEAEKQEPVAFVSGYTNGECVVMPMNPAVVFSVGTALYNAPVHAIDISQERFDETAKCVHEWVGLTDKDIEWAFKQMDDYEQYDEFAKAIEAKLKEKNCG